MRLASGSRLGPYEVTAPIGAGGMGEVYRGRDASLNREVAIKVLPAAMADDPERLARFKREAQVLASLNHPNIAHVYGFESATLPDGAVAHFLAMEMVDGEDLSHRLKRGAIPVDEAIAIAKQIAEGLEEAHEKGIVHRDLKPANIKLTPDGKVKVLDFGLAKAYEGDSTSSASNSQLADSPTMSRHMTEAGMIMGTAAYMSPEQARGKRVDKRADIWAFGVVLYEMLTGVRLFVGETVSDTLAAVLKTDPDWSLLPGDTPPHLGRLLRRCLERDVGRRLRDIGDARFDLTHALEAPPPTTGSAPASPVGRAGPRGRDLVAWCAAALALAAFGWSRLQRPELPESPVVRTSINVPTGEALMSGGFPVTLSPQGDQIAFVTHSAAGYRTFVRRTSELDARTELAPRALRNLTFSPDGRWIAYTEGLEVRRAPAGGGEHEVLGALSVDVIEGLAWAANDELVLGTGQGLYLLPARGGTPRLLGDSVQPLGVRYPWVMPGGRKVIARSGPQLEGRLAVIDLESGRETDLGLQGDRALGIVDAHLVFQTRTGGLSAAPFDAAKSRLTGDAFTVESDARGVGLSESGALAYISGATQLHLVLAGRDAETILRDVPSTYRTPRFSPDGRRVAVVVQTATGTDVWVLDRTANTFTRITASGVNTAPEWTADGRRVLYKGGASRIMWVAADGSAPPEELFASDLELNEALLSPDGRWLVVRTSPSTRFPRDIFAVDLRGDRKPVPLAGGPTSETMPRLSPDGRWLAYQSDVSGRFEVYVRPFPGEGARVHVSDAGGTEPLWSSDGRTLFYRARQGLTAVAVRPGAELTLGTRRLVLPSTDAPDPTHPSYDVAPDGSGFLISRLAGGEVTAVVIHNWRREFRERRQRVPSPGPI